MYVLKLESFLLSFSFQTSKNIEINLSYLDTYLL